MTTDIDALLAWARSYPQDVRRTPKPLAESIELVNKLASMLADMAVWRDIAHKRGEQIPILERERDELRELLAELVACKDLADQRDYNLLYAQTTGSLAKAKELDNEYRLRKNDAWRNARAAIGGKE